MMCSPSLKPCPTQKSINPSLFSREGSQRLSQDEPRLELQDAMCLLWDIQTPFITAGWQKRKITVSSGFLTTSLFCIQSNKSDIVMHSGHMGRTDENSSRAGQRSLRASMCSADRHRDSCVKVSSADTSRSAAELIPLSGLHNSPPAICGWPTFF